MPLKLGQVVDELHRTVDKCESGLQVLEGGASELRGAFDPALSRLGGSGNLADGQRKHPHPTCKESKQ
jgi:hypothetical protein